MARILLVSTARGIPLMGPSGASAHLRDLARALVRAGHRVVVAVPTLADGRGSHGEPVDVEVITLPPPHRRGALGELAEVIHARRLLDRCPRQVDLVWARHAAHSDAATRWARRHRIPCWLEVDAPLVLERDLDDPIRLRPLADALERRQLRDADRVLAVSRWLVEWASALGARAVQHLPNGTAPQPLHDPSRARAALGLPEGPVLGFVGSCKPWHRLDRLPALLDALPDATALVVGTGPSPPPPHPRVRQVVRHPVHEVVAAMDLGLVLGTRPWTSPLKIWDYRAQGVPVLSVPFADAASCLADGGEVLPWGPAWVDAARAHLAAGRRPPRARTWDHVVAEAFASDPTFSGSG